ncbi:MAG TPA: xanthine dehydrogenase family protein subunit M [Candidatus Eremiobacteraeota bacterium]|nr:MAG: Nicotinate dehydrogenase FAD-subunit [bacterium ADurb.Bin363]HPZ07309.1 xanthine dehydrogenase family protein subunit M [Candidatus Eremiobacteraeota bacterium]
MRRFSVIRIRSLEHLFDLAEKGMTNPYFLAGGTDLLIKIKDDLLIPPFTVLDISGLQELRSIHFEQDYVRIGSLVTHGEIEKHPELRLLFPSLTDACHGVGSPQIRNRATIGGNIGNASPAADSIPPLYVYGAELHLVNSKGERWVKIEDFFTGPGKTIRNPVEIIKEIRIPAEKRDYGTYLRLGQRKALAISKISLALAGKKKNGSMEDVKIALGAVGPTVIMAVETSLYLRGKELSSEVIKEAGNIIEKEAEPITDLRSSKEYRKKMCSTLLVKALTNWKQVA